jgi:hypothetical protein
VIDQTGVWELPFLGSIILLLLGSVLAFRMRPDREIDDPLSPRVPGHVAMKKAAI